MPGTLKFLIKGLVIKELSDKDIKGNYDK